MVNASALNTTLLNGSSTPTTNAVDGDGVAVVGATINGGALNSFGLNAGASQVIAGSSQQRTFTIGTSFLQSGQATAGWTQFCVAASTQITSLSVPRLQVRYVATGFSSYWAGTARTPFVPVGFKATNISAAYRPHPQCLAAIGTSHIRWAFISGFAAVLGPPATKRVQSISSYRPTWGSATLTGSLICFAEGSYTTQYGDTAVTAKYVASGSLLPINGTAKTINCTRAGGDRITQITMPETQLLVRAHGTKRSRWGTASITRDVYEALPGYTICWGCVKMTMRNTGSKYSATTWQSFDSANAVYSPRVTSLPLRTYRSGRAVLRRS